jgi:hypothetical protein
MFYVVETFSKLTLDFTLLKDLILNQLHFNHKSHIS